MDHAAHIRVVPARAPVVEPWPPWVPDRVRLAFESEGISALWGHQGQALAELHAGRHVVIATGTASGKSLVFQVPALTALAEGRSGAGLSGNRLASVLYLAPTKALAADQLRRLRELDPGIRAATVDGDNSREERVWARDHAAYVLTNPDTLHHVVLPQHERWRRLLGGLRYVVIDECHNYRGVFGAHVAHVLRRLRRVCEAVGATPQFVLSSATVAEPRAFARRLTGLEFVPIVDDASPHGPRHIALVEPPLLPGEPPARRSAGSEAADLLADLVCGGQRALAFVRSRRGAEVVAMRASRLVAEIDPALARRIATYRGGYLPEERRELEARLRSGDLLALATTNALELGIDASGLDAVISVGYPGTRAALFQQFGRAGREGQESLGVLVARDDPLDTYLVNHPEALLGAPVEATVFDPDNPYVLGPHLAAAAAEIPLTEADFPMFGPGAAHGVAALTAAGLLRRRLRPDGEAGWFWTKRERASDLADLRSSGGRAVRIVDSATGRLIGTVDAGSADATVHDGAVYVHQGETYVVEHYAIEDAVSTAHADDPGYTTQARSSTSVQIVERETEEAWGPAAAVAFGSVDVTSQVTSFLRHATDAPRGSAGTRGGGVLSEEPLDLPERTLRTKAVWWTLDDDAVSAALSSFDPAGSAHAAEHAAIGLLPLLATCDRWDVGGLSTVRHPDTGKLTIFVHDGHPGGAGFAERGHAVAARWLQITREAITACTCDGGCPSCVQSPKCGNGNHPLDKAGAVALLDALLASAPVVGRQPVD
jgi:DEAD/DEAH box helicase domain-containing protein